MKHSVTFCKLPTHTLPALISFTALFLLIIKGHCILQTRPNRHLSNEKWHQCWLNLFHCLLIYWQTFPISGFMYVEVGLPNLPEHQKCKQKLNAQFSSSFAHAQWTYITLVLVQAEIYFSWASSLQTFLLLWKQRYMKKGNHESSAASGA